MGNRIVIVDDHDGFRRTVRRVLVAEGFDVVGEAARGEEALELAALLVPDAVLADVQLPDIDGFEVARRLAAGGRGPCVVLTSSRERADYGALVERSGARGFLAKADISGSALRDLLS